VNATAFTGVRPEQYLAGSDASRSVPRVAVEPVKSHHRMVTGSR
jgi:hypothetical protein